MIEVAKCIQPLGATVTAEVVGSVVGVAALIFLAIWWFTR